MNDTTSNDILTNTEVDSSETDVEQRLAEIAAALAAKQDQAPERRNLSEGMACPIDPAERALCEGCQ